jgi:hypothetical protein
MAERGVQNHATALPNGRFHVKKTGLLSMRASAHARGQRAARRGMV